AVCECLSESLPVPVVRIGVNDTFGQSGTPKELLRYYGLDAESIENRIIEIIKK
ncbi:transketolase family protein, partial [bacterium]|nr:transketolase family protein [bacterium]